MYFVYILKSVGRKRFYIGASSDVSKRLAEHNRGCAKSTKPYRPWQLVYTEKFKSKTSAYKREFHLKHPRGYLDKIKIIESLKI
ncbi:GIY-YIG nuclease family protein [Candidatus Gracilibacteria bacterium]|nr:GIY-YIG nuclease family protein [Candidatus Gracilibacteria bacterium]